MSVGVSMAVSVAPKYAQVDQVDSNASDSKNEHQLAINLLGVYDTLHCLIDQDACHHPYDQHRQLHTHNTASLQGQWCSAM